MKNILLIALVAVTFIPGCKKSDDPAPPTEPNSATFNNKIWSGEMNVEYHQHLEPFSLFFKEDSVVEWYHASAKSSGKYKVANKKITVSFDYYLWGPSFTADIESDTKLSNFVPVPNEYFKIRSCEVNTTTEQAIYNTTWSGPYGNQFLKFVFKPDSTVQVSIDNVVYRENASYGRDLGYLRINTGIDRYYGVFFKNTIKGIYIYSSSSPIYTPYTLTRQ